MRLPLPMRKSGLKSAEYKLIGEIIVLSGMIEDTLKRIPLEMFRVDYIPGISLTAHLTHGALCDIISSSLDYFLDSEELCQEVEVALKLVRAAYAERNIIAHGPFWVPVHGREPGAVRFTARGKLKEADNPFDRARFETVLDMHIKAWDAITDCYVGMFFVSHEREEQGLPPLRPDVKQRANGFVPMEEEDEEEG